MKVLKFMAVFSGLILLLIGTGVALAQDEGLKIFKGERRLAGGAPPCIGCHSIASLGIAGGRVGPDLGGEWKRRGESWLRRFLSNPDTPVMSSQFKAAPLTAEEIDALIGLFKRAAAPAAAATPMPATPPPKEVARLPAVRRLIAPPQSLPPRTYEGLFFSAMLVSLVAAVVFFAVAIARTGRR